MCVVLYFLDLFHIQMPFDRSFEFTKQIFIYVHFFNFPGHATEVPPLIHALPNTDKCYPPVWFPLDSIVRTAVASLIL